MSKKKQILELTWIGKENRPKLEPRILVEDPEKSGMGISGVMRWYRGCPMIPQTQQFKAADSFWFTSLHKSRHVLQERKKKHFSGRPVRQAARFSP